MRVLSVIGIIFTAGFLIWVIVAATSNGSIDMDEFAPIAFFYGLFMLAVTIMGTIKGGKRKHS